MTAGLFPSRTYPPRESRTKPGKAANFPRLLIPATKPEVDAEGDRETALAGILSRKGTIWTRILRPSRSLIAADLIDRQLLTVVPRSPSAKTAWEIAAASESRAVSARPPACSVASVADVRARRVGRRRLSRLDGESLVADGHLGGEVALAAQSPLGRGYGRNVPSGPAGAGSANASGTGLPGMPFTDCVEYANVSTEKAMESLFTSSACRLLFANVSHAW
jgi:hypothetical protein